MVAAKYLLHTDNETETRKVLLSFAKSIQERDTITYEHSHRVAVYAQQLAHHLEWTRREAQDLALAALVHDLGKTWIANEILNKSAALSAEERRKMQRHPVIGARILIGCDVSPFYVETVLYHHEAWNGQGYPFGLKGEEIPVSARILAIADVYDVLTSQRPYKAPLTAAEACERLREGSEKNFDPTILQAFLNLLDAKSDFPLAHSDCTTPIAKAGTSALYPMPMSRLGVYSSKLQDIDQHKLDTCIERCPYQHGYVNVRTCQTPISDNAFASQNIELCSLKQNIYNQFGKSNEKRMEKGCFSGHVMLHCNEV